MQPTGQPPACSQGLQGRLGKMFGQMGCGEPQGLQGPPPQPEQPPDEPNETPVRVSHRPAPSEPAPRNLKNCLRDERRASIPAVFEATSTYLVTPAVITLCWSRAIFSTLKAGVDW